MYFDKITNRITKLAYGLNPEFVDPVSHISSLDISIGYCILLFAESRCTEGDRRFVQGRRHFGG